jgi:hypothetical protein
LVVENAIYNTEALIDSLELITKQAPEGSLINKIQDYNLDLLDKRYDNKYAPTVYVEFDDVAGPVLTDFNAFDMDLRELLENEQFVDLIKKEMSINAFNDVPHNKLVKHITYKLFNAVDFAGSFAYIRYDNTHLASHFFWKKDHVRGGDKMYAAITKLYELKPDIWDAEQYLTEMANMVKTVV